MVSTVPPYPNHSMIYASPPFTYLNSEKHIERAEIQFLGQNVSDLHNGLQNEQ